MSSHRQPPTSGAVTRPAADRPDVAVVGVTRDEAGGGTAEHRRKALPGEPGRLRVADAEEPVAVERRQARTLTERDVERGDIRVPEERLGGGGNDVEVDVRDELGRAVATLQALHEVDLRVGEHRHQVACPLLGAAGDPVIPGEGAVSELHRVAGGLPPLDAAQDRRAIVVRGGRRRNADRASLGQGPPDPGSSRHRCGLCPPRRTGVASPISGVEHGRAGGR